MLLEKDPENRPDASTLMQTNEVQKLINVLINKIKKEDSEMA